MAAKKKTKSTESTSSSSAKELRFIFHERLFEHMAAFRAAGYRYGYRPVDLAYVKDGKSVRAYELDEIVLKVTTVTKDPSDPKGKKTVPLVDYQNPVSVEMVARTVQTKKGGKVVEKVTYDLAIDPPLVDGAVELVAPKGTPFPLHYRDTENPIPVPTKVKSTQQIASINCCTSTLSAFYREWQRLKHAGFENDNDQAKAKRLPKSFHQYFMVTPKLAGFEAGGAAACDLAAVALIVQDGGKSCLADLRDMRRGDIAQIFWKGYKDAYWEERKIKKDKSGKEKTVWVRAKSEPVVDDPDAKRLAPRPLDYAGHSVFIHDVLHRNGQLYFQALSAQDNNLAAGGTRGVGLAGSGRDAYAVDQAALQAELFERAKCYRYEKDNRTAPYRIVPELFVGRLRRPFPCWPVRLKTTGANKVPLPVAFKTGDAVTNLHDDDVSFEPGQDYRANCEQAGSGFYPIGLSRAWHGGVHFKLPAGTPVRAIADGVIVAARCAGKPDGAGPSRNFVLIRHQVAAGNAVKVFYSLSMHLRHETAGSRPFDARWLWQFDRTARIGKESIAHPDSEALSDGGVVCLAYPLGAGEIIGHSDGDYLHFEVVAVEDLTDGEYPDKDLVADSDGDALYDSRKLLALLESKGNLGQHLKSLAPTPGAAQSGVVLQDEIVEFFGAGCEKAREVLRGLVTRHVSEWSTAARWPELKDTAAWGYYDAATAKALQGAQERNAWLTADVARWCKLPADGVLVHYHPVVFIDWLAGRAMAGAITPVVQRVAEILDGGPAPAPVVEADDDADALADDEAQVASVRWEIDPDVGIATLALGTLGPGDGFKAVRREAGPWTQIGRPYRSPKNGSEFVKVAKNKGGLWICVRSAGRSYARQAK
jgi:murein DD-endopeptidase MepM/ murein hydrolase activator NlpD